MGSNSISEILKAFNEYLLSFQDGEIPVFSQYGELKTLKCVWNPPLPIKDVETYFSAQNWFVPEVYKDFLRLHNGGTLFTHPYYGGGIFLLDLERMDKIREEYCDNIPDHWIPIAWTDETIGSICIDTELAQKKEYPYMFFLNAIKYPDEAIPIHCDFKTWLLRLLSTHGEEFWLWDYNDKFTYG